MTTQELKITIQNLVNETDDPEILQSIYVLLKKLILAEAEEDIIGYEADGTAITSDDFLHSILDADLDIENGNFISFETIKTKYGAK